MADGNGVTIGVVVDSTVERFIEGPTPPAEARSTHPVRTHEPYRITSLSTLNRAANSLVVYGD